jgi:hypothetical protein
MKTITLVPALLALSVSLVACSSADPAPSGSSTTSPGESSSDKGDAGAATGNGNTGTPAATDLQIIPATVYTGFDGTDAFKAPVISVGGQNVKWTLSDPGAATLEPSADGSQLMIVTKKAGSFTLTATAGGKTATAKLSVTAYTNAQHAAGAKRYGASEGGDPPCSTCHGGASGKDHTPTQLVFDTDDEIIDTFTKGVDPEGVPVPTAKHKWTVTEPEKLGLVSYLRSLEPRGYPSAEDPGK